jgi:ECF transporter S component (folate family)
MNKTKQYVYIAVLITLNVIIGKFISIETTFIQISFGFITVALAGYMFGPIAAGIVGAGSDVISTFLSSQGAYFPGFTISAFVTGIIYGLAFYKKQVNIKRIFIAVLLINVFVNMGMDTFWLSVLTGKAFIALIGVRSLKDLIMMPIQMFLIYVCVSRIGSFVKVSLLSN